MNKHGRPVEMHLSAADDAAMYAEYLHQCLNVPSEKAGERARGMIGNGYEGDRRTIQRLRKNYTSCGATLLALPDELRMKYPEFKE